MKIINKIINYIRAFLSAYIFMPIHAWYSFYFHNKAILNNSRNQQALDYLSRLAQDKTIQPQTPVEHYIEKELQEACEMTIKKYKDELIEEYGELPTYEKIRSECAGEIALEMMSYMWVEEEKWDDE